MKLTLAGGAGTGVGWEGLTVLDTVPVQFQTTFEA